MKIQISVDYNEEEKVLEISDEEFSDNNNYISLFVGDNEIDVPVKELYSAIKMFYDARIERLKEEKLYK